MKPSYQDLEHQIRLLKESNAEKDRLLQYSSEGIYVVSSQYEIQYMNAQMIKMMGGNKVGQKCFKAIYNKDKVCEWCNVSQLEKGKRLSFEVLTSNPKKYYSVNSSLLDNGSKILNYHDITERVEIETKIKNLNLAVEQSANAIIITNAKGIIEYTNKKFTDLTGYTKTEAIGRNPKILNAGTQAKEYYADMWKTISAGKIWKGEFHNKKKNGEFFWELVTITPIIDESGKITNYLAIKEDYTARKKAEEALNVSEEKFRKLFDVVPALLDAFDENGKCIYWNKECEKVFGWTIDEINSVENSLALFYPDPKIRQEVLESVTNQPEAVFKEWRPLTKKGEERIVMWSNVLLDDNTVINIGHDITELKNTEKELKAHELELSEAVATKDKFFSIISHDLKSPFNAILGFTNILLEKHREYDEDEREELIKYISNSANNAFNLLENLLTWSRNQSGTLTFSPEYVYLKILVYETISDLEEVAHNKNIQILETISKNDIVFADKNMLATVFRNLISNALKFTPKGGKIHITSKTKEDNNFIEVSVTDTGVGILENRINDLFRIDKNTTTKGTENERGTGLGLILCKEFIEKHGGKIWVESKINEGSTFKLTIPCQME